MVEGMTTNDAGTDGMGVLSPGEIFVPSSYVPKTSIWPASMLTPKVPSADEWLGISDSVKPVSIGQMPDNYLNGSFEVDKIGERRGTDGRPLLINHPIRWVNVVTRFDEKNGKSGSNFEDARIYLYDKISSDCHHCKYRNDEIFKDYSVIEDHTKHTMKISCKLKVCSYATKQDVFGKPPPPVDELQGSW